MTSLEEHLAATYDDQLPDDDEGRKQFTVDSLGAADWCGRKLLRLADQQASIRAEADVQRARIAEWETHEVGRLQHDVDYFTGLLEAWAVSEIRQSLTEAGGRWDKVRSKTLTLPCGVAAAARKKLDEWEFTDPDAFVAWAKANRPDLVKVVEEPRLAEAKKLLLVAPPEVGELAVIVSDPDTGELVPGVAVRIFDPTAPGGFSVRIVI